MAVLALKSCGVARWSPKRSDLFQLPTDDDLIGNLTFWALCHFPEANPTYFLQCGRYCPSGSPLPSRRDVALIGLHSTMRIAVQSEERMPSISATCWVQQHHLDKTLREPTMMRNIFANNHFGQCCMVACRSVTYFFHVHCVVIVHCPNIVEKLLPSFEPSIFCFLLVPCQRKLFFFCTLGRQNNFSIIQWHKTGGPTLQVKTLLSTYTWVSSVIILFPVFCWGRW